MFKNDRMMMILTGLVLAIFAGSMVQYGDRIMALMSGEAVLATQDDSYSVRAGSSQTLDVLSNDAVKGPIVVLSNPSCGSVVLTSNNRLSFSSDADCDGEVEFAYCVDSDGECAPNAVRINVISVAFAQNNTPTNAAVPAESSQAPPENRPESPALTTSGATEADDAAQSAPAQSPAPAPAVQAPEIATFAVVMAPPALAAPSISELISPSMAVASIRQSTGGLNTASNADQNIAVQNSAEIAQTASSGPTGFSAPGMGESSNISLGGSAQVIASNAAMPNGLQATSNGGNNITQLERGPEALASLPTVQNSPAPPESAPLSANPERSSFAPVVVATAQTNSPTPDARFSAEPVDGGPIALIALSRTPTRGNAAGESLNVILSEPGLQSFATPLDLPEALAPTSARPSTVTVLERAPSLDEKLKAMPTPSFGPASNIALALADSLNITRGQWQTLGSAPQGAPYTAIGKLVAASQPVQVANPAAMQQTYTMSRYITVSALDDFTSRATTSTALAPPRLLTFSKPAINLTPANTPPVLQASLPVAPQTPIFTTPVQIFTAPAQNSVCDVSVSARLRSGAMVELDILAACKPNQMATISHSGLSFSVLTDVQGAAKVQVPAMEAEAEFTVRFEDQSTGSTQISVADIANVLRAGVSWQANMNLDLSAIEFGAAIGSEGYISPQTPRDYRTSRIKGGGYLLQLGDDTLNRGALAEVYTLPLARNQQRGTIALSIMIEDVTPVCGQAITAKTVRTRDGRNAAVRNVRFTVPDCGTVAGQIALPGAIDDIRLAGR